MTVNTAFAILKSVKSSPVKVMKITKNISGRPVSEVLMVLQCTQIQEQ